MMLDAPLIQLAEHVGHSIVALDASLSSMASVCVVSHTSQQVLHRNLDLLHVRAETITAVLDAALTQAGILPTDVGSCVVGLGPGSYTGLRVALATAKGFALGAPCSLFGFCSFDAIAAQFNGLGRIVLLQDARGGDAYVAAYERISASSIRVLHAPAAVALTHLSTWLESNYLMNAECFMIEGKFSERWLPEHILKNASPMRICAKQGIVQVAERIKAGKSDSLWDTLPMYLRASEPERKAGISFSS